MFNQSIALNKQQGFGMVEIIVSMLVLGIAVIGFAALQIRALDVTGEAMFRTQAMSLAQDLAERMTINPDGAATYRDNWDTGAMSNYKCETENCTPAEMAQYDMKTINELVKASLPEGQITLLQCIGHNNYCVYVSWNKTQPDADGTETSCSNSDDTFVSGADCVKLETSLL